MNPEDQVEDILRHTANVFGFDPHHDTVVVGVSGGPDSLALLHLLSRHLPLKNLIVAHLDHGLRPYSANEAALVATMAGGMRFFSERVDVTELARTRGQSIEEAGRAVRYDFLARVGSSEGAKVIAVGHNADDQVETILMHFLRGSGLSGLRGMRPVSPLPARSGYWLIRPLLRVTRDTIDQYCRENGLTPILDESNADTTFFRNRIRHELLPALETYSPQIRRRLLEMSDIIATEDDFLSDITDTAWQEIMLERGEGHVTLRLDGWRVMPLALRRRALRRSVGEILPTLRDVGFRALESLRRVAETADTGAQADIPGGGRLLVSYNKLILRATSAAPDAHWPQLTNPDPLPLPIPGEVHLAGGWRIAAEWLHSPDISAIYANADPWTAIISLDPTATVSVRPRRKGERMRPLGMAAKVKIKDIMINRKLPRQLRDSWPIITADDKALWIVGHVMAQGVKVQPGQTIAVRLRCWPPAQAEAS